MGGRDKERMEADTASRAFGSQWQFWADAILSRILALQIKARQTGLPTPVYGLA